MITRKFILLLLPLLFFSISAHSQIQYLTVNEINTLIDNEIRDTYSFSGLAAYYNGVKAYIVSNNTIEKLEEDPLAMERGQSLALIGHFKILLIHNPSSKVSFDNDELTFYSANGDKKIASSDNFHVQLLLKSELHQFPQHIQKLKYAHLWLPFRLLCLVIEKILLGLNAMHKLGWGLTIIFFSFLIKLFMVPNSILVTRIQRKVSYIQATIAPEIEHIKSNFSGEEAHQKLMALYKQQGVTPFYTLKPLPFTLIPLPFAIAVFNVLGELDLIDGSRFLWIKNLAYPDAVYHFAFHIPLLGNSLNLMPVLMTVLTVVASLLHHNKIISVKENRKQKLNLYLMALTFFVLFYPFPSAMVFYWALANTWQLIQQRFLKI